MQFPKFGSRLARPRIKNLLLEQVLTVTKSFKDQVAELVKVASLRKTSPATIILLPFSKESTLTALITATYHNKTSFRTNSPPTTTSIDQNFTQTYIHSTSPPAQTPVSIPNDHIFSEVNDETLCRELVKPQAHDEKVRQDRRRVHEDKKSTPLELAKKQRKQRHYDRKFSSQKKLASPIKLT